MDAEISKSQFKAKALEVLREVEASGQPIVVTDRGKPTIEVRPYRRARRAPLDALRGTVARYTDPTEPVAEEDWEATR